MRIGRRIGVVAALTAGMLVPGVLAPSLASANHIVDHTRLCLGPTGHGMPICVFEDP